MGKYNYNRSDFTPPAPAVPVRVSSPGAPWGLTLNALIDSGADNTVLPSQVVEELRLPVVGTTWVAGAFDTTSRESKVFAAELTMEFTPSQIIRVIPFEKSYALLGRDILNRHKTLLDGPQLILEVIV